MSMGRAEQDGPRDRVLRERRASTAAAAAHTRRRAAALVLVLLAGAAFAFGVNRGAGFVAGSDDPTVVAKQPTQLPRGGTELLPAYRLIGFSGAPQDTAFGALGIGTLAEASRELTRQARAYRGRRPLQPFFELIATVANADAGLDGLYRSQQPPRVVREYLKQARTDRTLLVLDIQPGRAEFSDEVDRLLPYLRQPDVGLGLDPEWRVGPDEVPGQVIGSIAATEVNEIAAKLSRIVRINDLPQKLLIVHQFTEDMITNPERLRPHPGVALVLNVDGFGTPADKKAKYRDLRTGRGGGFFSGFKLFYEEDVGLMSPREVLKMKPTPDLVVYE